MTDGDAIDLSQLAPWAVSYPSAGRELAGFLIRPAGNRTVPGVVINHGSGGLRPRLKAVADAVAGMGYAAFLATRRGYNGNGGPNWRELVTSPAGTVEYGQQMAGALRAENDDVLAAAKWLAAQPGIAADRLGVMGTSFGGQMTMLAISRSRRFRAAVNFAGAAMNWESNPPVREMLLNAAQTVETPVFLVQAVNDYSIGPTYDLGYTLARFGRPHEARIYPPNGESPAEGHDLFATGISQWRDDVARFFARWL